MKTIVSNAKASNATASIAKVVSAESSGPANIVNKRPASLDLNKAKPKPLLLLKTTPSVVDPTDMKTLNTPDLEKILLSSNMLPTPQPGLVFPSKVGEVTSEQEAFGKGFEEALHSLHNSKTSQSQGNNVGVIATAKNGQAIIDSSTTIENSNASITTTSIAVNGMSGGSFIYTNLDSSFPVAIKDEPQNPPASPPTSPIDMETQEKIKLERKRQRNRVAASKCRKRKLERISKLEDKVKILKGENVDLGQAVKALKDHVAQLKQQVIEHIETGCKIPKIITTVSPAQ